MTCGEVRRVLPQLMERVHEGELGAHLRTCAACSELVSDLQLISQEARQLAAADEPAPRVWLRIAAELRAEGVIREPRAARPAPIARPRRAWSVWWLAPVAAALVAGASYLISQQPISQVAEQKPAATSTPAVQAPANTPATVAQTTVPKTSAQTNSAKRNVVEPGPSADDQQFLSEVAQRAPSMRTTYEDQLRSVNAYIQAAQAYLDQNPNDEEARQHLMEAYQQKALLYQMALDHIQ